MNYPPAKASGFSTPTVDKNVKLLSYPLIQLFQCFEVYT